MKKICVIGLGYIGLSTAVKSEKLKESLKPVEADVFIIAVPTPFHDRCVLNRDK